MDHTFHLKVKACDQFIVELVFSLFHFLIPVLVPSPLLPYIEIMEKL